MNWPLSVVSIYPKVVEAYRQVGVIRAAEEKGAATLMTIDLRDFAVDKHATVDGSPYGGGDGMVMRPDCLASAVEHVFSSWGRRGRVVFTSPSGTLWTQTEAQKLAETKEPSIFICGRFAGVDQRFVDQYVTDHYSLGDFVLAGGELAVLAIIESALRFVPGVLGNSASSAEDSFGDGLRGMLEYPSYTRPQSWNGLDVPDVLLSGDHKSISKWRQNQSRERTQNLRPDLIKD